MFWNAHSVQAGFSVDALTAISGAPVETALFARTIRLAVSTDRIKAEPRSARPAGSPVPEGIVGAPARMLAPVLCALLLVVAIHLAAGLAGPLSADVVHRADGSVVAGRLVELVRAA